MHIKRGDTVGVISPSGYVEKQEIEKGLDLILSMGLKLKNGPHIFDRHYYLAGKDKNRAKDLNTMFNDRNIKAIFCTRGGYGSMRLLPYLDINGIKNNPKYLIGYSDITFLHILLNLKLNIPSLHGPMLKADLSRRRPCKESLSSLENLLFNKKKKVNYFSNKIEVIKGGRGQGILTGGCLSIICSSIGVLPWLDFTGKILFLEDVNERPYKLDRLLTQLKLSGLLSGTKGIILGKMESRFHTDEEAIFKRIIKDILSDLNIPILYGIPSGHTNMNLTLPFGTMATIDSSKETFICGL